jgi:hypothetical protein
MDRGRILVEGDEAEVSGNASVDQVGRYIELCVYQASECIKLVCVPSQ